MNLQNYDHLVTRFLQGRLSDSELAEFLTMLESDKKLQMVLKKETTFDSWILEQTIHNPQLENLKNDHDWAELVTSESVIDDKGNISYTDNEWGNLIQNSLAKAKRAKKSKIINFPALRYLVAACLLMIFGIGTIIVISESRKSVNHLEDKSPISQKTNINPVVLADTTSVITTEKVPGVLRVNDNSALLVQKESKILFKEKMDTVIHLELTNGTALFNVEKGKYRRFVVSTPIVNVTVTGTVFKVTSDNGYVLVSVLEGSVRINHCKKNTETQISRGEAIIADKDSLIVTSVDSSALLPERALLLNFINHTTLASQLHNGRKNILSDDSIWSTTNEVDTITTYSRTKIQENEFRGIFLPLKNNPRAWDVLNNLSEKEKTEIGKDDFLRKVRTLTTQGDTMKAISLLYDILKDKTGIKGGKNVSKELLSLLYARNLIDSADILIKSMYQNNKLYKEDEQIILWHAEILKKHKSYRAAHSWYSFFVEHFPASRFKSDAYYQMWWCLIQDKTSNNKKMGILSQTDPGFSEMEQK